MQTNKIGKIAIGVDGHKQSSFDLTHDNESTYNFGVVKPLFYKEMKPHSKVRIKTNDIILASPFNVMTIGRILYETLSFFVPRHKVFPRLDSYLTGEPMVAGNESVESMSTVVSRPCCHAGILNLYTLIGAKLNVWVDDSAYTGNSPEELITFNSNSAIDGRRFCFNPIEAGGVITDQKRRANVSISAYESLVGTGNSSADYSKILRCGRVSTLGSTASEPIVNPNSSGDFFNDTRSHLWFNLSMAGRRIQLNNFSKMTDVQKANFPEAYEDIITAATGGDDLTDISIQANSIYIPLANSIEEAFGMYIDDDYKRWLDPNQQAEINRNPEEFVPTDLVTPQNADVIIPYHFNDVDNRRRLAFGCFRLSDAGKRLREILKGLEMPTNVGYSRFFDCERLLAWYMAYYEAFGVQAFENIHNTPFGRLIETMRTHISPTLNALPELDTVLFNNSDDYRELSLFMMLNGHSEIKPYNHCVPFILSLMDCWLTDSQDFMSVQQNSVVGNVNNSSSSNPQQPPTVSALYDFLHKPTFGYSSKFLAPNYASNLIHAYGATSGDKSLADMPVQSSTALHTAIDSVLLLKVAKWVNRQTATGHNIQKILRVMGFGNALDQLGANFIGKTSTELSLQEVQASSDTYNSVSGDGHKLGELTTRSLTFNKANKGQKYSTEDGGHWVTMAYLRPVSTYSDSVDCEGMDCERSEEYMPDFDGIGMEYTPYSQFFNSGAMATVKGVLNDPSTETFGLVPRDSHRKVNRLVLNGGFFHNSQRGDYDSFHLNRRAPLGDLVHRTSFEDGLANFGSLKMGFARPLVLGDIPKAGIWTRSYYRYAWLSNLERIFSGHATWSLKTYSSAKPDDGQYGSEYFTFSRDNFIVHTAILGDYRASMKPIEVSYQTFEVGKDANGSITKE